MSKSIIRKNSFCDDRGSSHIDPHRPTSVAIGGPLARSGTQDITIWPLLHKGRGKACGDQPPVAALVTQLVVGRFCDTRHGGARAPRGGYISRKLRITQARLDLMVPPIAWKVPRDDGGFRR